MRTYSAGQPANEMSYWPMRDDMNQAAQYAASAIAAAASAEAISPEHYALARDAWWRMMSLTMSLLDQTQQQLEHAQSQIAVKNARLFEMERAASHDMLTDLKNRRGFQEDFAKELDRCKRGISCGGVLVLIDMDNFKHINDTYGHMAGDAVLRLVGTTLGREVRVMDTAARLGGDEFVLLLANADKKLALTRIQKISKQLNNLSLIWDGHEIAIRASVGMKAYNAEETAETIMSEADHALYQDKRNKESRQTK